MDKRELKRHKRHVARAKAKTKVSEPDVRTIEEIQAARELSRPAGASKAGQTEVFANRQPGRAIKPPAETASKANG